MILNVNKHWALYLNDSYPQRLRGGIASPAKKMQTTRRFSLKITIWQNKWTIKHRIARVLYVTTEPLGTIYSIYLYLKFKIFKKYRRDPTETMRRIWPTLLKTRAANQV